MKRWTRWGIGLLCAVVVTFGVRSITGVSHADEASPTVTGTVQTIDAAHDEVKVTTDDGSTREVPISKTVWVFLDNHKAKLSDLGTGFKVELILNGKKQAAYIKAITITVTDKSAGSTGTAPSQAAGSTATPSPHPSQAPAATSAPTPTPAPAAAPAALPASPEAAAPWQHLQVKVEGKGFKLDLLDKGDDNNGTSMIRMTPKGHDGFLLKGNAAEQWIRTLMAGVDLQSPNAQQQISTAFANWFELNGITLNVNIEIKAKIAPTAGDSIGKTTSTKAATTAAPLAAPTAAPASTPAPSTAPAANAPAPVAHLQITVSHDDNDDDQGDEDEDEGKGKKEEHDNDHDEDHDKGISLHVKMDKHKSENNHGKGDNNGKNKGDKDD